jgi:flagellin
MGFRINTNVASIEAQRNLKMTSNEQVTEFAKLSSGKRITKASDDAAGLAISKNLEAQNRSIKQASRNASDGVSMVQVAEGGLNETSNILTRLRELSIQSASDTLGNNERKFLQQEFSQLTQEMDRIASSTQFNGFHMLKGSNEKGELEIHVGAFGSDDNKIKWDSTTTDATTAGLSLDGVSLSEKEDAVSSLEVLDSAINKVSEYRSTLGSVQSRLQSSINNLETQHLNQEAARSRIEDVDIAEATARSASINVRQASGIAVLAQANSLSNGALRLIG